MSFPRYPKYKASGVEWLGEVPEHWEVVPFKHRCSRYALYGANMSSDEYVSNGVRFLRTTDISENGELEPDGVFISPEVAREYLLKDKDILISRSGTIGRAFVFAADVHPECAYAGYLVRFVPTKQLNSRLFFYFTKSVAFSDWLQTQLIFSTIGNVNGQKYAQCRLTLPPIPEQITIAAFLDHETAKIDELVAEQERLIDLLKEKRQAVISHAVTKGLNPDAPMKDSGIEWLGDVPAGWEVGPLKRYWSVTDCKHVTAEFVDDGIPLASIREVQSRWVTLANAKCTTKYFYELLIEEGRRPLPGDLIFSRNATVGEVAQVNAEHPPFAMGQDVVLLRKLSPQYSSDYLQYVIRSPIVTEQLANMMIGSTFKRINVAEIRSFIVPLPPHAEQAEISEFTEAKTAQFDTLTTEANRVIDLLKERRTALISAAVTGQIDVRNLVSIESA